MRAPPTVRQSAIIRALDHHPRFPEAKGRICVSTVSIVRDHDGRLVSIEQ
jgi:hypothetical protein